MNTKFTQVPIAVLTWSITTVALIVIAPWLLSGLLVGLVYQTVGIQALRQDIVSMATADSLEWMNFPTAWSTFAWVVGAVMLAFRTFRAPWTLRQIDRLGNAFDQWSSPLIQKLDALPLGRRNLLASGCLVLAFAFGAIATPLAIHQSIRSTTPPHPLPGENALPLFRTFHPEVAIRLADGSIRSGLADVRQLPDGSYSVSFK